MKVYAILAAAGTGKRFSSNNTLPKQFLKLKNKPVILYSLLALQKCKSVNHIIISADRKYFGLINRLAAKNKITKLIELAEGGRTRFESVRNAFKKIKTKENDLVLIHDAVRPIIDNLFVSRIINAARKENAVVYGLRIVDTVKREKAGYIDRSNLWTIQTPQVFKFGVLINAYKKVNRNSYTDESSLVEKAGYGVKIIKGSRNNIKITNTDDLKL
jgi:2-C-methyl-D-erythritol 4-phosphate cytidylyltransferase